MVLLQKILMNIAESAKPLGSFILKNWYTLLPWLFLLVMFIYNDISISNKETEIANLQSDLAKQTGLYEVAQNLYEGLAIEVTDILSKNDSLVDRLDNTNRNLKYQTNLTLQYKAKIDSISTYQAVKDTIRYGTTVIIRDSSDRMFKHRYKGDLYFEGYFNTHIPYQLFLTKVQLDAKLDIAVSQAKNGQWFWNVDTHSDLLKPTAVEVKINPRSNPWEGFYGIDVISNTFNILSPSGIGLHGGIKKGNYAGKLDIRTVEGKDGAGDTQVGFGLTKYFEF